ncbi:MAG: hypothetical protein NBKEAIPA_03442 [Nitrospirae bacterium]|nr:MAG: hypothetical protein UZ03_NOB001000604 [Nitrospira sp. OLB3]MBV6471510.1 hypothetical protein [Nitrospirota bacterium]
MRLFDVEHRLIGQALLRLTLEEVIGEVHVDLGGSPESLCLFPLNRQPEEERRKVTLERARVIGRHAVLVRRQGNTVRETGKAGSGLTRVARFAQSPDALLDIL